MKTYTRIFKFGILFTVLFMFSGCLEYETTTIIHPNGKIERLFLVSGDYDWLYERSAINLPADTAWEINTWWELNDSTKQESDSTYFFSAYRVFKNYKELNEELKPGPDVYDKVKIETRLKRKFRWFFTYIEYTETYKKHFPFDTIAPGFYLEPDELKFYLSDYGMQDEEFVYDPVIHKYIPIEDADTTLTPTEEEKARAKELRKDIDYRFTKWEYENIFAEFFKALSETFANKDNDLLFLLHSRKEMLYDSLDITKNDILVNVEDVDQLINHFVNKTIEVLELDNLVFAGFLDKNLSPFFNKLNYLNLYSYYTYKNNIIMPGNLIRTNSQFIEDNKVTWETGLGAFYTKDFVMQAESRILNIWAVLLSVVVIMFLAGYLILPSRHK